MNIESLLRQAREDTQRLQADNERMRDQHGSLTQSQLTLESALRDRDRDIASLRHENTRLTDAVARAQAGAGTRA